MWHWCCCGCRKTQRAVGTTLRLNLTALRSTILRCTRPYYRSRAAYLFPEIPGDCFGVNFEAHVFQEHKLPKCKDWFEAIQNADDGEDCPVASSDCATVRVGNGKQAFVQWTCWIGQLHTSLHSVFSGFAPPCSCQSSVVLVVWRHIFVLISCD